MRSVINIKIAGVLAVILLLSFSALAVVLTVPTAAAQQKGPVSDVLYFRQYTDEEAAILAVRSKEIHMYAWRLPPARVSGLQEEPDVTLYSNPRGGLYSLLVNPVPESVTGEFNPFEFKKFRWALQFLIDRDFFVSYILGGYGVPMLSCISPNDPDWLVVGDYVEALGIPYSGDEEYAYQLMTEVMTSAGAVKQGDKWYYKGKPVKIKFFIRVDDPIRLTFGMNLASKLEEFGITVERVTGDLWAAFINVYMSDPKELKWHLYTEGWGSSAFVKYSDWMPVQMYAPWLGFMPGWGEPTYWNYKNDTIDEITKKLAFGEYKSKEERDELLIKSVLMGVEESVRIWVGQSKEFFVTLKEVEGVITDFGAGIANRLNFWNAKYNGEDTLIVGVKYLSQGAWNPMGGYEDWYTVTIYRAISDPGTWRHPHLGEVMPWRITDYTVTSDPDGNIPVPSDALKWDPLNNQWVEVGSGKKAKAKVVITYNMGGGWHDGNSITMNDIRYTLYMLWEWVSEDETGDKYYDPVFAISNEDYANTILGIKFIGDDTIEVYVDYWHFDEKEILAYASFWASTPWYLYAAMEEYVVEGKAAFTNAYAQRLGVEWLNLVARKQAMDLVGILEKFAEEKYVPPALEGYITPDEAADAYQKAALFIRSYGHAVISNGPYKMTEYVPNEYVKLEAFRTHPFDKSKWEAFTVARCAEIRGIEAPVYFTAGTEFSATATVLVGGEESSEADVVFKISGPEGVVYKGTATPGTTAGEFIITVPASDTSGWIAGETYTLKVIAVSRYCALQAVSETPFLVVAGTSPSPTTSPSPSPTTSPSPSPTTPTSPPPGIKPEVIAVAVVLIIIIAIAAVYLLRRR